MPDDLHGLHGVFEEEWRRMTTPEGCMWVEDVGDGVWPGMVAAWLWLWRNRWRG